MSLLFPLVYFIFCLFDMAQRSIGGIEYAGMSIKLEVFENWRQRPLVTQAVRRSEFNKSGTDFREIP